MRLYARRRFGNHDAHSHAAYTFAAKRSAARLRLSKAHGSPESAVLRQRMTRASRTSWTWRWALVSGTVTGRLVNHIVTVLIE